MPKAPEVQMMFKMALQIKGKEVSKWELSSRTKVVGSLYVSRGPHLQLELLSKGRYKVTDIAVCGKKLILELYCEGKFDLLH